MTLRKSSRLSTKQFILPERIDPEPKAHKLIAPTLSGWNDSLPMRFRDSLSRAGNITVSPTRRPNTFAPNGERIDSFPSTMHALSGNERVDVRLITITCAIFRENLASVH